MVIFYDKDSLDILYTEGGVIKPTLPPGSLKEQREILSKDNVDFLTLAKEMGLEIYNYKVNINYGKASIILKQEELA